MSTQVKAAPERSRYEILVDGEVAGFASYRIRESDSAGKHTWVFDSTEVDPKFRGQGLAGKLVRAAMDDVREKPVFVEPECSYVVAWFDRNADYQDLLDPGYAEQH